MEKRYTYKNIFYEHTLLSTPERKMIVKRDEDFDDHMPYVDTALNCQIKEQVQILISGESDRAATINAILNISAMAEDEHKVALIVNCEAIPALVQHLKSPPPAGEGDPYEHEVKKASAFTLGLLAVKPAHQLLITEAGALPPLVNLLKTDCYSPAVNAVISSAADVISSLALKNRRIQSLVRDEGGIPPLVYLLDIDIPKIAGRGTAARSLVILCIPNALCYEAVNTIRNLVDSSESLRLRFLNKQASVHVFSLLRSSDSETQLEAALLVGQLAATRPYFSSKDGWHFSALALIKMLQSPGKQSAFSAFALGRLAQMKFNQADIGEHHGILPLLNMLTSKNSFVQQNAMYALYGLANRTANVLEFIILGGLQKLQAVKCVVQLTEDIVQETRIRIQKKVQGRLKNMLLVLMFTLKTVPQTRVVLAFAHLSSPKDHKLIFIANKGLRRLLDLLKSLTVTDRKYGAEALLVLAKRSHLDAAHPSPTPQVYRDEQYINNPAESDVKFLVGGEPFYAHKDCLRASSDVFLRMFDGGFIEGDANDITITEIELNVFELLIRYMYTGSANISSDIAHALFEAADYYHLEGLKSICQDIMAQEINMEKVRLLFAISKAFHAPRLRRACIKFTLEHIDELSRTKWYDELIEDNLPEMSEEFEWILNMQ